MEKIFILFVVFLLVTRSFNVSAQATAQNDTPCSPAGCDVSLAASDLNSSSATLLYPNPATNEVNVIYDAAADVKNIAVYNIIGKILAIYRVNGNSANLDLENIPSGIYFVRLLNSRGDPVITRKFTKQ